MAEGGGDFGYDDPDLDYNIDNDDYDNEQEVYTTRAQLQLPIKVESTKCKRCSTSRAGFPILLMRKPLC